jgi:membrane protease YdiL (CAAX protease family)
MTQRPRGAVRVPIKKAIIELLLAVPLTFALYFVMAWVSYFVYQMGLHSPGDVEIQTQIGQMQSGDLWWPVLFIAFVGPIAEEIVCRGFLLNAIKSRTNWALALVVQAILFAGLHSYSMVGQAMIFVFGLVFGGLYLWRKSLLSSIFVHCLLNGLLVSVAFWNGQLTLDSPFLGVTTEQVDDGVVVVDVAESSPAQSLGLKIGDKITACGENSVRKPEHIVWIVQSHPLDEDFPIWLTRDGKELYFEAKLMTRRQYQQLVSQPK